MLFWEIEDPIPSPTLLAVSLLMAKMSSLESTGMESKTRSSMCDSGWVSYSAVLHLIFVTYNMQVITIPASSRQDEHQLTYRGARYTHW